MIIIIVMMMMMMMMMIFFFFLLAFAGYTIRAAREMTEVVFSSSCLQR